MRPPARAIVGNLVWSTDRGVWAVWRVEPFPHANTSVADKLAVHSRIRSLLVSLPSEAMFMSLSQRLDPWAVAHQMTVGVDLRRNAAWREVYEGSASWLGRVPLHEQRYYVAAMLPAPRRGWLDALRRAAGDVGTTFGQGQLPVADEELDQRQQEAAELQQRLGQHVGLTPVTAGELCWMYARAVRREADEPPFDDHWEPHLAPRDMSGPDRARAAESRPRAVLAHLTDVVVREGGDRDDEDRPRHRRYVRIDNAESSSYQTVLAMSDMPHYFMFPNGGGEWLFHADNAGFPVDWCVRVNSVANADAQAKVRRKQRDLLGQVEQYDGEVSGAPPQLAEAIRAIDEERSELGANPSEAELQVSILLSIAAPNLPELEKRAAAMVSMFKPQEYGLARPTGGQLALLRSMLPGAATPAVAKDYTQFMLARDLAAGSPFCRADVGDPQGLLLGVSLDGGTDTPVLFDPAYGPQVNASPSLATVGRLGSGKSFFLKRICWDTVARGGQVVTVDRSRSGEYARFAETVPGSHQVVHLEPGSDVCLDPMRSFSGDERAAVTLGFLSMLAGSSPHTDEGAALAEAVDAMVEYPEATLGDVVDELDRMAGNPDDPDPAARALARRLAHYRRSGLGRMAFGEGEPLSLEGDFIVFWAPNLSLPDKTTLAAATGDGGGMLLPEHVLAQALLYLVAAVGRQVVFRDSSRFAAALYDEAWSLLASPQGQSLLVEGIRDGRKHNGAIWLASQHPNDFAVSELTDLLGSKFVFDQARQAVPAALSFLGLPDSEDATGRMEAGLATGQCIYRDVRGRLGTIQVLPPALARLDDAFNTAPVNDMARPAVTAESAHEAEPEREPAAALSAPALETLPAGSPALAGLNPPSLEAGDAAGGAAEPEPPQSRQARQPREERQDRRAGQPERTRRSEQPAQPRRQPAQSRNAAQPKQVGEPEPAADVERAERPEVLPNGSVGATKVEQVRAQARRRREQRQAAPRLEDDAG